MHQLRTLHLYTIKYQKVESTGSHWCSLYFLQSLAFQHSGSWILMDLELGYVL